MSKRKIDALERRAGFLRARVAGGEADGVDLSYDKQELGALLWAVDRLRAPPPEGREQVISASGNFPVRLYGTSGPLGTAGPGILIFVDPNIEEHTIEVRDAVTERVLGKIINIGGSSPQEERKS